MAFPSRQYELVLLGATGYTGKLTAEHITTSLPTDLNWAIAGRNEKKLKSIVDELSELNPDRPKPAIEICELKKAELDALAKKTKLIITTVGPYMLHGEPVLSACAENGTHYLDCTGEVPWLKDMIEKYDATAKKTGAIIIPQCGLDSVPADLLSYALTTHIKSTLNSPTASVTMSLHDFNVGVSGGTSATMLGLFSHYSVRDLASAMKPYALSPVRPTAPTSPPKQSFIQKLLGLRYIQELGLLCPGIMASADTAIVHRSWGLYEKTSTNLPAYGPHFRFTEYMRSNYIMGSLTHYGILIFATLMAFPLTRWILTPLIKTFLIPKPGEGPAKEKEKNGHLHYRAVAVAESGSRVKGNLEWNGGAYALTGLTLAEAGMVILRGDVRNTEAGKREGGLLTPACLGLEYLERLRGAGVKINVGE